MLRTVSPGSLLFVVAFASIGCTDVDSPTDLNPEGPPMVRQVIMTERLVDADGVVTNVSALAFGTHPDFNVNDDGVVRTALVAQSQKIRVVVDELLVGNHLEEILCRDLSWDRVPLGATPDDIAKCAVSQDLLPTTCTGEFAVCMDGDPENLGIKDDNEDGAVDDTRFITERVQLDCGTEREVTLLNEGSFWQPSGNQQVPAAGGFNAVGPAIILQTANGLPTNVDCTIVFDDKVIDKSGERLCAPPDGDIEQDCPGVGDTSLISFHTEPLRVNNSRPSNNQMNVPLTASGSTDATIEINFNADVDAEPRNVDADPEVEMVLPDGSVTVVAGDTPVTGIFAIRDEMDAGSVLITIAGGFEPGTTYTVTVTTGVTDTYGSALPEDVVITFTTAPAA